VRYAKLGYLALGLVLLAVVVVQTDLAEAWDLIQQVGWGFALILGIYFVSFLLDVASWQLTVTYAPLDWRWFYRLWKLRMVGEAFNNATPLATMGGEPVKAYLLKKLYGVGYREGVASLVLSKTTVLLSLVVFLGIGFFLMLGAALPGSFKLAAGAGLFAVTVGILLFYLVQHKRITTRTLRRAFRGRVEERLETWLNHVQDLDDSLVLFYTRHRRRFGGSFLLALATWILGVGEVYVAMAFLGHPVTFTEAFVITAVAELVRAGAFFIPGRIGAQEGAFIVVCAALTGSPTLGLAVALVRRVREIIWIVWGLGLGWAALPGVRLAAEAAKAVQPAVGPPDRPGG
jgi:uncharacterized protein (TIRG00374 family)